jgi:hypothetical protein
LLDVDPDQRRESKVGAGGTASNRRVTLPSIVVNLDGDVVETVNDGKLLPIGFDGQRCMADD